MRNPFQPPEAIRAKLNIAVEGPPGDGKTWFGLLAKEVPGMSRRAVITNEQGEKHYVKHPRVGGYDRLPTQTLDELDEGVTYLENNPDAYDLLQLDTTTGLYEALVAAKMNDEGEVAVNDWGPIKRKWKGIMTRLVNLSGQMHVVQILHETEIIEKDKSMRTKVIGTKADAEKTFSRNPDTIIRIYTEGKRRYALVKKDRTGTFQVGEVIENPHISMWAKAVVNEGKTEKQLTPDQLKAANEGSLRSPAQDLMATLEAELGALESGFFADEAAWKAWGEKHKDAITATLSKTQATQIKELYKDKKPQA